MLAHLLLTRVIRHATTVHLSEHNHPPPASRTILLPVGSNANALQITGISFSVIILCNELSWTVYARLVPAILRPQTVVAIHGKPSPTTQFATIKMRQLYYYYYYYHVPGQWSDSRAGREGVLFQLVDRADLEDRLSAGRFSGRVLSAWLLYVYTVSG